MAAYHGGKRPQPQGGYQLYSWYFLRVSGLALIVLALGHLFFTHYVRLPYETNFNFVAGRYAGPFWRTFDLLLLTMALIHGPMMGAQLSIEDYVHRRGARQLAVSALYAVGYTLLVLGLVTVLIFQRPTGGAQSGGPLWLSDVMGWLLTLVAIVTYVGAVGVVFWLARAISQGVMYWGGWGMVAWVLHRAAGLGVAFFLLIHIVDIMLINVSPDVYDATVVLYKTPFLVPMEIALVGAVVYHGMNGLRVIALDVWVGALRRQRELFFAVVTLTVVLVAPSALFLIFPGIAPQ